MIAPRTETVTLEIEVRGVTTRSQRMLESGSFVWFFAQIFNLQPFSVVQQPLMGQDLLIIGALQSHSDTPHSVGLLWTSAQYVADTSTSEHTTLTRDRHPCPQRDSNT